MSLRKYTCLFIFVIITVSQRTSRRREWSITISWFIYWWVLPSNFKSYTVILPKKSELSSNSNLIEDIPPSSNSGWVGTKLKLCRRFTSSGYMWQRICQAMLESVPGIQTAHRVPTKPPWKTIESRLGVTLLGKPSWMNWGSPCVWYIWDYVW